MASRSLYVKHERIHPREVEGIFDRLRGVAAWVLLGLFYGVAWLQWDGRQALLFDLPERKFYVLGLVFWPQDFYLLAWLLIIAAVSLFFFTALGGRLWCGYACPQTVWTEAFIRIERFVEGNAPKRKKLDRSPWTANKIFRRTLKHGLWLALAAFTGFTFVGYFTPIRELTSEVLQGAVGGWSLFWIGLYGLATYGNAGHLREQVCKYMCPYARFQGAMFDSESLIISYDEARGEPRGSRRRGSKEGDRPLGDCIDCTLCVQACPTGIDIRKGLQYECIACGACIDACEPVMDKMGYDRGLIRYTTENSLAGLPTRIFRPRIIMYGTLLTILVAGFVYAAATRPLLSLDVVRDRNALFREVPGGRIENSYSLRIINKTDSSQPITFEVDGLNDVRLVTQGEIVVAPGSVGRVPVRVSVPYEAAPQGSAPVEFRVSSPEREATAESRFIGPKG